jgi:hypothetical protein
VVARIPVYVFYIQRYFTRGRVDPRPTTLATLGVVLLEEVSANMHRHNALSATPRNLTPLPLQDVFLITLTG